MSNSIGNVIADSLSLGLGYAQRLQKDITQEQFARFATADGKPVESNHAAFVFGHLSLYAPRIIDQLGVDASQWAPSDQFNEAFSKDATCQDDPDGTIYPAMPQVLEAFTASYEAAKDVLRETDDAKFSVPNPAGGRMLEMFPTLGSMHAFYAGGHFMMHMGQLSAWRRMIGLGPA